MKFTQNILFGFTVLAAPAWAQSSFAQAANPQDPFGSSVASPFGQGDNSSPFGNQPEQGDDMFGSMMDQPNALTKNADQLMFKGMAVVEECQVNPMMLANKFGSLEEFGMSDGSDATHQFLDSFHHLGDECSPSDKDAFHAGLEEFNTCAGFNLGDFLETLPSAIIGTLWECLVTEDFSAVNFNDPTSITKLKVSPACLNFQYGANPFGDASRSMVLKPDVVMKCFGELSPKIPLCSISQWPIPLVGKVLRPVSCIIGKLQPMTDVILASELEVWESCLPKEGSLCTNTCLEDGSLFIGTSNGVPVSDALSRVATTNGQYASTVKRYMKYTSECTQMWEGFENPENMEEHNSKVAMAAVPGGSDSSKGFGFVTFFAGLLLGAVLFKVVMMVQEKRGQSQRQFQMADTHYAGVPVSPMV